jgi:hypothetical protein
MVLGILLLFVGLAAVAFGMFGMANTQPIFVVGIVLSCSAFALLVWSGWRGRFASWLAASPAAIVLTWITYEAVRQSPARPDIGVLGLLTAPLLSLAAGIAVIVIGWARRRSVLAARSVSRDTGQP